MQYLTPNASCFPPLYLAKSILYLVCSYIKLPLRKYQVKNASSADARSTIELERFLPLFPSVSVAQKLEYYSQMKAMDITFQMIHRMKWSGHHSPVKLAIIPKKLKGLKMPKSCPNFYHLDLKDSNSETHKDIHMKPQRPTISV